MSLYTAEACNELAGPISALLVPVNTASFEKMLQRWRAIGNTVSDLTRLRFEPQASRSRDERYTARPTGRSYVQRCLSIQFISISVEAVVVEVIFENFTRYFIHV